MSIDKAMIPFKGRSSLKQYIPNRGIRVWVSVNVINGAIKVYAGKQGGVAVTGLGQRPQEAISGKNYRIYCDNYFTSVNLINF